MKPALIAVAVSLLASIALAAPPAASFDTAKLEELSGAKGKLDEKEGVFKVSLPRSDLSVTAAGAKMVPSLGLTAWAAFKKVGKKMMMMMGDMVLLEDQVNPVMDVAFEQGLEVTALHNHFFWDSPKVMFMHIGGMGDEQVLAAAVGKVFNAIRQTSGGKGMVPKSDIDPSKTNLDAKALDAVLEAPGELKDGVYKVVFGRSTKMHGMSVGSTMGVNTWAAFAGSKESALVDGDFAVLEPELQDVLRALRAASIYVVAIHNHMTGENPRVIFLHYWGVGPAQDLAKGVRAALGKTKR